MNNAPRLTTPHPSPYMELKETVIMDVSDSFRTVGDQEMTKTDFFDFVVAPDSNDAQSIQQFTKQMRNVNVFLGNGTDHRETNNNNSSSNNNNNTMIISDIPTTTTTSDTITHPFDANLWNEKDTVKIETAILEDLNKYCWTNDEVNGVVQIKQQTSGSSSSSNNNNTDGQIYTTLTVLNGLDQHPTWYRQPLSIKEEDVSISSPTEIEMEHLQGGLDIDSILSIMPGQINAYNTTYNESTMSPNTDGLIKSETYTYEDSGFADNKEELANSLIIDTPLLEAHDSFNNNNNDWKLTNNNQPNSSSPDSLLRSALQGKAFVRYNGALKTSKGSAESNAELRRCLSESPTKIETIYLSKDEPDHIPTIVAGIDANGKVVFEEQIAANENPTSTHTVEDLLLNQLDHPYDDFENKLKRIANEVAESVNQYCIDTSSSDNTVQASLSTEQIGILYNITSPIQITAPVVTSTKTTKKYKRSNSGNKAQASLQSATSTSNGVRKERSLHYCSICSKGFKDKYSVNVHIRTHTGEKPFACSLCGKTFRQKAHLAKHYQTHIAQKNAAAAGNVSSTKTKAR